MAYFTHDFALFFSELEGNNNTDWFNKNKKRYEKSVKEPFLVFVTALIEELKKTDKALSIAPKDTIHRIHRDIRFSKDKSPYKLHASAIISNGGKKDMNTPGMYIELSHLHVRVYGGCYMPDAAQLAKIRSAIASDPDAFAKIKNDSPFKSVFGEIRGEKNKRLPEPLRTVEKTEPLVANKQFYYFTEMSGDEITSENLVQIVASKYATAAHLNTFLGKAIS